MKVSDCFELADYYITEIDDIDSYNDQFWYWSIRKDEKMTMSFLVDRRDVCSVDIVADGLAIRWLNPEKIDIYKNSLAEFGMTSDELEKVYVDYSDPDVFIAEAKIIKKCLQIDCNVL